MITVEIPIVSKDATSVTLRPTRSPKSAEPIGRATKAMANVASDCSVAAVGSPCGKKMREDNHGGGRINIEVEELNGGANERGDDDLIARIDRSMFLFVIECGGGCLYRVFSFLIFWRTNGHITHSKKRHFNL